MSRNSKAEDVTAKLLSEAHLNLTAMEDAPSMYHINRVEAVKQRIIVVTSLAIKFHRLILV